MVSISNYLQTLAHGAQATDLNHRAGALIGPGTSYGRIVAVSSEVYEGERRGDGEGEGE